MGKFIISLLLAIICSFFPLALSVEASVGIISGRVLLNAENYLLLQLDSGQHEVVRVVSGASLGNLDALNHLRSYRLLVEVSYTHRNNNVLVAQSVVVAPRFNAGPFLEVPPEQVAILMAAGADKRHVLIDVRRRSDWDAGHIEKSLSVPFTGDKSFPKYLPSDKSAGLIFYGQDNQDDLSHEAARLALSAGYSKVQVCSGGLEVWRGRGYPVAVSAAGAKHLLAEQRLLVADVRTGEAWSHGHIPDAFSIPGGASIRDPFLIPQRNYPLPILFVGNDSKDGVEAITRLNSSGYYGVAPVSYLEGGFTAWANAGFPVEKGGLNKKPEDIVPIGEIAYKEFYGLWNNAKMNRDAVILNIRDENEFPNKDRLHIPFEKLEERLSELPRDKELIVYCYSGTRARIAYHLLKNNRFRSRFVNRNVIIDNAGKLSEL